MVSNGKLLCQVGKNRIFYKRGYLFIQDSPKGKCRKLLNLPVSWWRKTITKVRILERLLRLEPRIAIALNENEFLLSYQGKIFRINCENGRFEIEHYYRKGMNNALSFCNFNGSIIYGEYFGNSKHEEVCIYQRQSPCNWVKMVTFSAGTVGHIHKIVYDKYRECMWVLTGDSDKESGIWKADVKFHEVKPIFVGKQKYRSCFLAALRNGLLYATDTPLEDNAIYFIKETSNGVFQEPKLVQTIPGPCIYGTVMKNDIVAMATSVEPDSSLPIWRYRITFKLGKGVHDRFSHLIVGNIDMNFQELCAFKKDKLGMWLFQFGNLLFPDIDNVDELFITGQALEKIDGKTIRISLVN